MVKVIVAKNLIVIIMLLMSTIDIIKRLIGGIFQPEAVAYYMDPRNYLDTKKYICF